MSARNRWVIIVLSAVAAGLSLWLTWQKVSGKIDTLAGCGAGSDCDNVLGSKWSMVFGTIPVSVFSALLYIAVLASVISQKAVRSRVVAWWRVFFALLILGAAVWFVVLQLVVVDSICKYCMTMHAIGVLLAIALLWAEREERGRGMLKMGATALPAAAGAVMALAAIQHFGPEPPTHRVDQNKMGVADGQPRPTDVHGQGKGREVKMWKSFRIEQLPHTGPTDAETVVVKYYDYTCDACKDMHDHLEKIQSKYSGKLAVILLPTPINRACNPHLPLGVKDHAKACELSRLALKVWRADPAKFIEFHHWLFDTREAPVEIAEAMAISLVSEDRWNAVDDHWVDEMIAANTKDYKAMISSTPKMPKLLLKGSTVQHGITRTPEMLEQVLRENTGLK